jgi:nucleoside-diphosphate-sugar epimerase
MLNLVTGGAGFLGSHLVDALLAQGDDVIVADNLQSGRLGNIDEALRGGRAAFVYLDLGRPILQMRETIMKLTRRRPIDRIFHLASPASPGLYRTDPWEALCASANGSISLIELAVDQRAQLVYRSTSDVTDERRTKRPIAPAGGHDSTTPLSWYDHGRRFGEAAVAAAAARRGLDARIVRFFDCYGPRMSRSDGCFVSLLAEAISAKPPLPIGGNLFETRSMLYVEDAIQLLLLVADAQQLRLASIDIAGEEEHTFLEVAEMFARIAGVRLDVRSGAPHPSCQQRTRAGDLSFARSLGWKARTTLSEGLAKTLCWFREHQAQYV